MINVLICCEESQSECIAFRKRGFNAFSSDLKACSGGFPDYHFIGDCFSVLENCGGVTQSGVAVSVPHWDLVIAHPPCTYLSKVGNRAFKENPERYLQREEAFGFFMRFTSLDVPFLAIENPVGYPNSHYRPPNQIIQPFQFGHKTTKMTCLWLFNLPLLKPTNIVEPDWYYFNGGRCSSFLYSHNTFNNPDKRREARSKSFSGISDAMASQWGNYVLNVSSSQIFLDDEQYCFL